VGDAFDRMYRWYLLGCRMEERVPLTPEEFAEQRMLEALSNSIFQSEVFNRTSAEWSLAREDAYWTQILGMLANLNIVSTESDLVRTVIRGRQEDEDGESGAAGVFARMPPFFPVCAGAAALPLPVPELDCTDDVIGGVAGRGASHLCPR